MERNHPHPEIESRQPKMQLASYNRKIRVLNSGTPTTKPCAPSVQPPLQQIDIPDSMPQTAQTSPQTPEQKLQTLEQQLRAQMADQSQDILTSLNEYLALGLALADESGNKSRPAQKENWLRRVHSQLKGIAFCDQCCAGCRQQCFSGLQQTFTALKQHYEESQDGRLHLARLSKEMANISEYLC